MQSRDRLMKAMAAIDCAGELLAAEMTAETHSTESSLIATIIWDLLIEPRSGLAAQLSEPEKETASLFRSQVRSALAGDK